MTNQPVAPGASNCLPQQPQYHFAPAPGQMMHPPAPAQAASTGAADHPNLLYDFSSFDPLQAHALQLTASAGFTNLLSPSPANIAPGGAANSQQPQHVPNSTLPQHSVSTQPMTRVQQPQYGSPQQPAYYYIQPQSATTSSLQPIAAAFQQGGAPGLAPQPGAPSYLLPATAQRNTPSTPQNYHQQILPNNFSAAPGTSPGLFPGMMMNQHLQSVVANAAQHPAPLAPAVTGTRKRDGQDYGDGDHQAAKKAREMAPSVVSSSTNSTLNGGNLGRDLDKPPVEATQAELEKMTPAERRRYERNLREQQRSYKISQQIKELRDVLVESNVPFKANKYSILLSVVDYIKQLQSRAIMLDAEHQKLITTIRQTNEMVNSGSVPSSADELETTNTTSDVGNGNEMLFVQGLDYRSVFEKCPAALGVAALDGRILECNAEFQLLLGCPKEDLLKQSLFNLVRNHQEIFRAMAEMLKGAEGHNVGGDNAGTDLTSCFWSGEVISKQDTKVSRIVG